MTLISLSVSVGAGRAGWRVDCRAGKPREVGDGERRGRM